MSRKHLGEFEQLVLLGALREDGGGGEGAYAPRVLESLRERAGRPVARGALYHTLDRLEAKGYVESEYEEASDDDARGGHPRRRFRLTEAGLAELRQTRAVLFRMWDGLEEILEAP